VPDCRLSSATCPTSRPSCDQGTGVCVPSANGGG
jgi:hypothetical protein